VCAVDKKLSGKDLLNKNILYIPFVLIEVCSKKNKTVILANLILRKIT